jgi:hypothetical protein
MDSDRDAHDDTAGMSNLSGSEARFEEPASAAVEVEIAGRTHAGHVRTNNEDHYLAVRIERIAQNNRDKSDRRLAARTL